MSVLEDLHKLTFAVQHNPNCPSPFLVRLVGHGRAVIDLKPYAGFCLHRSTLTNDILGFGKTLEEAAEAAMAQIRPPAFLNRPMTPAHWCDGVGGDA